MPEPRFTDRPPLTHASRQACRRAIHAAMDKAIRAHDHAKVEEDEMRGCLEEAIGAAAELGDQATCDKLASVIEELTVKRVQRTKALRIIDEALFRVWR